MTKRVLGVGALMTVLTAVTALPSEASLIYTDAILVSGSGLGAVETLVTGHETTPPGVESGCVSWNGADVFGPSAACTGGGIVAGDEIANGPGGTVLLSTLGLNANQGGSVGVVLNLSETGQDLTVALQDLALLFYNAAGTLVYTATLRADFVGDEYTSGEGTGLGGSGFVFILDQAQATAVNALSVMRVGGGFTVDGTNDGNETLYAFRVPDPQIPTPEPASLALFGAGLLAVAYRARRKVQRS